MTDFLDFIFPEGEERWIKVLYTDRRKAKDYIRLSTNVKFDNGLGFEVTAIGLLPEHTPQIEALVKLKATLENDHKILENPIEAVTRVQVHIDRLIAELLHKTQMTSK
jgi:hypothetical protein